MSSTTLADPKIRMEAAPPEERAAWEAIRTVEDPELPLSPVDLGLIYRVDVEDGRADVDDTPTYSGCPARDLITADVEEAARSVEGIRDVSVDVVYSLAWSYDRITSRGRADLTQHGLAVPGDADRPDPDRY